MELNILSFICVYELYRVANDWQDYFIALQFEAENTINQIESCLIKNL